MAIDIVGTRSHLLLAGFAVLAFFFIYFRVPETKGRSIEDIEKLFAD